MRANIPVHCTESSSSREWAGELKVEKFNFVMCVSVTRNTFGDKRKNASGLNYEGGGFAQNEAGSSTACDIHSMCMNPKRNINACAMERLHHFPLTLNFKVPLMLGFGLTLVNVASRGWHIDAM